MLTEKNKTKAIVFWCLTAVIMAVIFYLSAQVADDSAEQSGFILELLSKVFSSLGLTDHIVRKTAHFLEFAALCFMFNYSLCYTKGKFQKILSVLLTSSYALSDEIHQIFVEGRSCQFSDWLLDTCGALFGLLMFLIVYFLIGKIKSGRKRSSKDIN
ncbi:MAG: VanZ family protein [Eubacterium sp.]|nr:VanZ family protein [Eubacterium sp.]